MPKIQDMTSFSDEFRLQQNSEDFNIILATGDGVTNLDEF